MVMKADVIAKSVDDNISKNEKIIYLSPRGKLFNQNMAKKFSKEGYRIAMLARSAERLERFEKELEGSKGYVCDVSNIDHLKETCSQIKKDMGSPEVLIHNAVKGNFEKLLDGKPEWLEENFRINTTSLMYLAHELIPDM